MDEIIFKLQDLECTLLGNGEDCWIQELLFKPGMHRYQLLEWIFQRMNFSIPKVAAPQNSTEGKLKSLLSMAAALGLCKKDNSSLVEGTASVEAQVKFWKKLVDPLWEKYRMHDSQQKGILSLRKEKKTLRVAYGRCCRRMNRIMASRRFGHVFDEKVNLFPPDVMKESEHQFSRSAMSSVSELKGLRERAKQHPHLELDLIENGFCISTPCSDPEGNRKDIDRCLGTSLADLCNTHNYFPATFNALKPFLHISCEHFCDVGGDFSRSLNQMELLFKYNHSLDLLRSSHVGLRKIHDNLENLNLNPCCSLFEDDADERPHL